MTDLVEYKEPAAPVAFNELGPEDKMAAAGKISALLVDVVEKQKLYTDMLGKKYVNVEGWTTLGALVKVLPKEREVKRLDDGTWEAYVDLIDTNGTVVGSGSAICGAGESMWMKRPEYARRSMAITRATGKAYRLGYSWMMKMAGYEVTPAEEMPDAPIKVEQYKGTAAQKKQLMKLATEIKPDVSSDYLKYLHDKCNGKTMTEMKLIVEQGLAQ